MKEGSKQVAKRESKSHLPRLVTQTPSSLGTVNLTLLLFNYTNTVTQKAVHYSYKDSCLALKWKT